MKTVIAPFPSLGIDCVSTLDAVSAPRLKAAGLCFAVRYLGSVTPAEVAAILEAGLLLSLVTFADVYDGVQARAELNALGIPPGATVWLDVESVAVDTTPAALVAKIDAWAAEIVAGAWEPGLYVGAGAKLTSAELYSLNVVRYWKGMSRAEDRDGALAEPSCGWCLLQLPHTVTIAGTPVDVDVVGYDYRGRLPTFVSA